MPERPPVFVHLLPSLIPPGALRGGVAVVVDVLRATTAILQALDSGIREVIPCLEVDDALRVAATIPREELILGGERQGVPIEGFDFGNSPSSYTPESCQGRTLVLTTTNGTRAILASSEAARIFIGAFTNLRATVDAISDLDGRIHLVCSGTDGQVSLEDTLLVGALTEALREGGRPLGNDSAEIAESYWFNEDYQTDEGEYTLAELLSTGRGGRRVTELGYALDIESAAAVGRFGFAAELARDREPHRIVRI